MSYCCFNVCPSEGRGSPLEGGRSSGRPRRPARGWKRSHAAAVPLFHSSAASLFSNPAFAKRHFLFLPFQV